MKFEPSRRDILKLGGMLSLGLAAPGLVRALKGGQQNVMFVVFDALSAYNVSLYGYPRETMPNLARLAERAVVYHNHYAGSNFTTPGTATLLTGTLPWTHRAFHPNGLLADDFVKKSMFTAFQSLYRIAYTHNGWAYSLLKQLRNEIDELIPWEKLLLRSYDGFIRTLFESDNDIASVSWTRNIKVNDEGYSYSLFLSHLYEKLQENRLADLKKLFPRGIPSTGSDSGFLLENAIDWISGRVATIPQPFAGYFHFLPPHFPYRTSVEFYGRFRNDGFQAIDKPRDIFAKDRGKFDLIGDRLAYDEFLLYVDREFGRLFNFLETNGLLENTWVVFTSDHGEMFERDISGHSTDAMYEPVIRIPLLIFEPGRTQRLDIHTPTSAADVLPTLAHVTGQVIPNWTEGLILPPFAESDPGSDRSVYLMRASKNGQFAPLTQASTVLVKGRYKLHYYFGYNKLDIDELVKLYDVVSDPEEMNDLALTQKGVADEMLRELKAKLEEVNKPYL